MLTGKLAGHPAGKGVVALGVVFNLSILFVYKYLGFVEENIESIFGLQLNLPSFVLPIGLSFCTFQAISYIIDINRSRCVAQKNPLNAMLYILMFPQLVAGPIVRYEGIASQLTKRSISLVAFSDGLKRFIIGLAKKVLLANTFAIYADASFASMPGNAIVAWAGVLAYTLQIYFDFSAYSDMAIGLGAMFGFKLPENFNYPYIASSVTDFWRRWHISLGMWFRDYVYFPLGGSRVKSKARLVFNLFVVWTLTGIWHGAAWSFIIWGLLYFILLTFEKLTGIPQKLKTAKPWQSLVYRVFTLLAVILGWVFFRAENLKMGLLYLKAMFTPLGMAIDIDIEKKTIHFIRFDEIRILPTEICWLGGAIVAGVLFATPLIQVAEEKLSAKLGTWGLLIKYAATLMLYTVSIGVVIASNYNPFLYFNF
jgi:alginate O-acetyltransferase complex protein AlgI